MAGRTFDQVSSAYPADVKMLATRTRALIRELLPEADEHVDVSGPYISCGYGAGYTGVETATKFDTAVEALRDSTPRHRTAPGGCDGREAGWG